MTDETPQHPPDLPREPGNYDVTAGQQANRPPIPFRGLRTVQPLDYGYARPERSKGAQALRIIGIGLLTFVGIVVLLFGCVLGTCAMMK